MKFLDSKCFLLFLLIIFALIGKNEVKGAGNPYVTKKIKDCISEHEKQYLELNKLLSKLNTDFGQGNITKTASQVTFGLNAVNDHYDNLIYNMEAACTFNRETMGNYEHHFFKSQNKGSDFSKNLSRLINYLSRTIEYTSKKTSEASAEFNEIKKTVSSVYGKLDYIKKMFDLLANGKNNEIQVKTEINDKFINKSSWVWKFLSKKSVEAVKKAELENKKFKEENKILALFFTKTEKYEQLIRDLKGDLNKLFEDTVNNLKIMKVTLESAQNMLNTNQSFSIENLEEDEINENFKKLVDTMCVTGEMSCYFVENHGGESFDGF